MTITVVANNVEQIWIINDKTQKTLLRFHRSIQILIGDKIKNGNDQKPTLT